jgi:hypothetical protein
MENQKLPWFSLWDSIPWIASWSGLYFPFDNLIDLGHREPGRILQSGKYVRSSVHSSSARCMRVRIQRVIVGRADEPVWRFL